MSEDPLDCAAKAHYVQEAQHLCAPVARALEIWNDPDPELALWRAKKIKSMRAAINAYAAVVSEQECYGIDGKHHGPGRNGCCLRGLMGIGLQCNDCPAKPSAVEKRERAVAEIKELIADGCGCDRQCEQLVGADVYCGCEKDARKSITVYEQVMGDK